MFSYVIKRAVATLPVMAMVAVVVFAMLRLTPGDPAAILAGDDASGAQLEAIRRSMGLDQPIMVQLYVWMKQLARETWACRCSLARRF